MALRFALKAICEGALFALGEGLASPLAQMLVKKLFGIDEDTCVDCKNRHAFQLTVIGASYRIFRSNDERQIILIFIHDDEHYYQVDEFRDIEVALGKKWKNEARDAGMHLYEYVSQLSEDEIRDAVEYYLIRNGYNTPWVPRSPPPSPPGPRPKDSTYQNQMMLGFW